MSVCGQNGHPEEDSASEETGAPARDDYKQKPASKVVRVLTVLAYLLSVSLAAILLSVYYVCVWKSPDLPPFNDTELSAIRASLNDYTHPPHIYNTTGGVNSTVSEPVTEATLLDDYELSSAGTAGSVNDTLDVTAATENTTSDYNIPYNNTETTT